MMAAINARTSVDQEKLKIWVIDSPKNNNFSVLCLKLAIFLYLVAPPTGGP
jgi:hypothetical protein